MHIAQRRDAARKEQFYFRKNVFSNSSRSASGASTPCSCENSLEGVIKKSKKLLNCYPSPEPPEQGIVAGPVESEYELMTMKEIMLGKVRGKNSLFSVQEDDGAIGLIPRAVGSCIPVLGNIGCR